MSSIFKALSSPFRIDSRGTNENAYSSYGQDEKLEFYILFSLNGFLGREKSGAHRAIISFCRPSTCLVKLVPSVLARQIRLASEIPGVGEYDVSKCEGNRLKGFDFGKVEDRWPDKNRFHHYQPTPGPGEYIKLHQSSSMGYQRESRYPTSSSSIVLRKHEILDSRSKYNTGPGKYEYVDSFGIQFESSKKTNPVYL